MEKIAQHKILVSGDSHKSCCRQVEKFFHLTSLVMYDCIQIVDEDSYSALDAAFFPALAAAEQKNRDSVKSLIAELQQTGISTIAELQNLEHGYPSKVLHIISHFLDGFIGIDSYFYNLPDDSHWLPTGTAEKIKTEKEKFWLIHLDGYAAAPQEAGLLHL